MSEWYKASKETIDPDPNIRIEGIKIETGVPLPCSGRRGSGSTLMTILDKLEIGNSILIPIELISRDYVHRIMSRWNSAQNRNKYCCSRSMKNEGQLTGTRIWRIE